MTIDKIQENLVLEIVEKKTGISRKSWGQVWVWFWSGSLLLIHQQLMTGELQKKWIPTYKSLQVESRAQHMDWVKLCMHAFLHLF